MSRNRVVNSVYAENCADSLAKSLTPFRFAQLMRKRASDRTNTIFIVFIACPFLLMKVLTFHKAGVCFPMYKLFNFLANLFIIPQVCADFKKKIASSETMKYRLRTRYHAPIIYLIIPRSLPQKVIFFPESRFSDFLLKYNILYGNGLTLRHIVLIYVKIYAV